MTTKQHRLIWSWIAGYALLLLATTVHWICWILIPVAAWAKATVDINSDAEEAGRLRLVEILDEYPLLKVWFGVCAFTFFSGAIYVTRTGVNLLDAYGAKVVVIAFAVLVAPLLFAIERERFKIYGEP